MGLFTQLLSFNKLARNDTSFAPWRGRPQCTISLIRVHPKILCLRTCYRVIKATSNLIRQWIIKKERGIISICDSIWLGTNSVKLTPYGGELATGLNRQNLISICDSIWLGTNLIKFTRYGGELGGGELAMGQNRQLPLGAIYPCAQQFFESVAR